MTGGRTDQTFRMRRTFGDFFPRNISQLMITVGRGRIIAILIGATALTAPAHAQNVDARISRLEERLRQQDARIAELEALLARQGRIGGQPDITLPSPSTASASAQSAERFGPMEGLVGTAFKASVVSGSATEFGAGSRLDLSGDIRLRYETNWSDAGARDRSRVALRARLSGRYRVTDFLTVGGQLATGDPDDPNSTDLTLSNFDDDAIVSLDQAYARLNFGALTLYGGKIPQVFSRTDLVWDGDVSPQGVSATYALPLAPGTRIDAHAVYFLIDESVAGPDSDMVGGQLTLSSKMGRDWQLDLAAGYFDYTLLSIAGADAGDVRSNLIGSDGRYLSDFNLFDAIGSLTYDGLGERWPVRISGDYVHNFGAATLADTGYSVDLVLGRASHRGDWRFGYGFARAETDAVFAAFSHDNLGIATNYRQHSLSIDYVPRDKIVLNATLYRYRPENAVNVGANDADGWFNRLRLNFLVNF